MFLSLLISCSAPKKREDALGKVTFDVSGTEDAKRLFTKGHLLMHSFEFMDAAEAFREAQTADPSCAMAFWGEAMTYHHAIWQEQDYEKGNAVLLKLGKNSAERLEKIKTEIEKDFMAAVEVLYGEGTKIERDKAYSDFMGNLYLKYPGNHEVASLYSLALLGSVPVGRDDVLYQKSAEISAAILKVDPNHPGALHYFIHANDDPYHAKEALFAANEYAVVAPDAAHALHMPTHIYVALGMWDKVISSNEESWSASVSRRGRKKLTNDALGYHSFHWLEYGYLQKGRVADAKKLVDEMIRYCAELPSNKARAHEIYLKSTFLVETNDWESSLASHHTDATDLNISTRGMESFVRGMKSYHDGDVVVLQKVIEEMEKDRVQESINITESGIALCKSGGASRQDATKLDIDEIHIMEMELQGLKSWKQNDLLAAEKWFTEATLLEQSVSYSYGPPAVVKPSFELYGDFLLAINRPEDAMTAFDASLKRAPLRVQSLKGKMKAAKMLNRTNDVKELEKQLAEI